MSEHNTLTFALPVLPVPLNNAFPTAKNGRRFLSDEGEAFHAWVKAMATAANAIQRFVYTPGDRLSLTISMTPADKRAWDVDGRNKLLQDALAELLGFDDAVIDMAAQAKTRHGLPCAMTYPGCVLVSLSILSAEQLDRLDADTYARFASATEQPDHQRIARIILADAERLTAKRKARAIKKKIKASMEQAAIGYTPPVTRTPRAISKKVTASAFMAALETRTRGRQVRG